MHNTSVVDDDSTARTRPECAMQRAENLAVLGTRRVLELCVGPSLRVLGAAYGAHGIEVTGNDIDRRWPSLHPRGRWLVGDAMAVPWHGFDAVVFAPPLSRGCTGRREDALRVSEVVPGYAGFISRLAACDARIGVMVLPARCVATRRDRAELHSLLSLVPGAHVVPLVAGPRRTVKYVDVYVENRNT